MSNFRRIDDDLVDPHVRRAYRDVAVEQASNVLDRAVLAAASSALARRRLLSGGLVRPLAWAAIVGLCLAIVLQVYLDVPGNPATVLPTAPPPELDETAVELRARKQGDAQREKSGPAARSFASDGAGKTPAVESTLPEASQSVSAEAMYAPDRSRADSACSADDRQNRGRWLACIDALEFSGQAELAAVERALLAATLPDPDNQP